MSRCLIRSLVIIWTILTGSSIWATVLPLEGDLGIHDPSTIIKCEDRYYVFSTGRGIRSKSSPDLIHWTSGARVFDEPPAWTSEAVPDNNGSFWAPDVIFLNGRYYLYYSVSTFGSQLSAIGLATNPTLNPNDPDYEWTDEGIVVQTNPEASFNAIDPAIFQDTDGTLWMALGSFWSGIKLVELDPTTGKRKPRGSTFISVAYNSSIEAACLIRHEDYYYLFVDWGTCCSRLDSTYQIRVGRSSQVKGPYVDREGRNMLDSRGEIFFQSSGRHIGPGHFGLLTVDGQDLFGFHYYDGEDNGNSKLGIARFGWSEDGWPIFTDDWSAFYSFESGAKDISSSFDGTLASGASIVNEPGRGWVLALDGGSQHLELPLSVANARTFAAWVKWNGGDSEQRLLDFRGSANRFLYLTPAAADGNLTFAINADGDVETIEAPSGLPVGAWTHVAVTLDGREGILFVNGAPVATNEDLNALPWQMLARDNWIGRNQDDFGLPFDGQVDAFRIFGRALNAEEISELARSHPALSHRWSFDADTRDSIGSAHAELRNGATLADGGAVLDGMEGHVNFPNGLLESYDSVTMETWVVNDGSPANAPIFDFGNSTAGEDFPIDTSASGAQYLSLRIGNESGGLTGAVTTDGASQEQIVEQLNDVSAGENLLRHIVWSIDAKTQTSRLFVDGQEVGVNEAWTLKPSEIGFTVNNWLGRSQSGAPLFKGRIEEFRIYSAALSPREVAANFAAGPDALTIPVHLQAEMTASDLTVSWPSYAVGFEIESTDSLGPSATWIPESDPPLLEEGTWRRTFPLSGGGSRYYRLRQSADYGLAAVAGGVN